MNRFQYCFLAILVGVVYLTPFTVSAKNKVIPVNNISPNNTGAAGNNIRRCISDVSKKNLLGLERPRPFALPTSRRGVPIEQLGTSAVADTTLKILCLRVEFMREVPDNPRTTGDGTFDMRTYSQFENEEGHFIDPAPHDKAYFNSHMMALRNYWYAVSDTTLELDWDIFPSEDSQAYQLPVPMSYYGAEGDSGWTDPRDQLGHFFIDAITLADTSDPLIDFSQYDGVIIFHAGADQQNNIAFIDDTPDDFYTGFIIMSQPIVVDNGAAVIQEGILMPEAASQDNRITALNAVMAHEFGHQLGLIDLYNTSNFMTQVGDFALMDNNGLSVGVQLSDNFSTVGGTLPVMPSAWSRAYLGFNVPREITNAENVAISAAAQSHSDTEIIKVPITEFEYFLIENRKQDVDTLPSDYPYSLDNALIGDETGVILGPGYGVWENGVLVSHLDSEYDRLLPGNGVLIWHVDEYVANISFTSDPYNFNGIQFNNYQTNSMQWDKDRRFLTVVEADGIIDLGGNYYRGYGEDVDFFKEGNNTAFTPFTNPATRSSLGADSHIFITGISGVDTIMTVDIDIDWAMPGWPQMSFPFASSDPVFADLDGDDFLEVLTAADENLVVYRYDGEKFIQNNITLSFLDFNSREKVVPWGVAGMCDTSIIGRPVPADYDNDDTLEVALVTGSGFLYLFEPVVGGRKAGLVTGFPMKYSDYGHLAPIAVEFDSIPGAEVLAFDDSGGTHIISGYASDNIVYDFNARVLSAAGYTVENSNIIDVAIKKEGGFVLSRISSSEGTLAFQSLFESDLFLGESCFISSADIDRDGGLPEMISVSANVLSVINADGSLMWRKSFDGPIGLPAIGDINSDGFPEIVIAGQASIYAFNFGGALLSDYPIDLSFFDLTGNIQAPPVLADLNDDGNPDIVIGLPDGGISAFDYKADRIAGFPLPSSFGIENAAAIADIDADGDIDILSIEKSGFMTAWDISASYNPTNVPWGMAGGSLNNSGYLDTIYEKQVISADKQLPPNSVYNYPNPAANSTTIRYYLNSDSDVSIDIFDFMGEKIHSVSLNGRGNIDNEYVWDCSAIASGVYFCRIEADNGSTKEHKIIKIALVK